MCLTSSNFPLLAEFHGPSNHPRQMISHYHAKAIRFSTSVFTFHVWWLTHLPSYSLTSTASFMLFLLIAVFINFTSVHTVSLLFISCAFHIFLVFSVVHHLSSSPKYSNRPSVLKSIEKGLMHPAYIVRKSVHVSMIYAQLDVNRRIIKTSP